MLFSVLMALSRTKGREYAREKAQDEALPRQLYEACQRLARIEPGLAWAERLTSWRDLPAWSRRLLAAACARAIRKGTPGAAPDEEALAESRAIVDDWITTESEDVDFLREDLVRRIGERLRERDTWIARLTAALQD